LQKQYVALQRVLYDVFGQLRRYYDVRADNDGMKIVCNVAERSIGDLLEYSCTHTRSMSRVCVCEQLNNKNRYMRDVAIEMMTSSIARP
jgi:hypothetical protein